MKKTDLMTMTAAMVFAASGYVNAGTPANADKPIIGKQEIRIKDKKLTPEALWAMGRIGSSTVSPDGKQIAYTVSYYSIKENKSHTVIYVMNADGTNNLLLTTTADSEMEPAWIKGGSKIAFLSAASGSMQLWEMNPDGSERKQLSAYEGGIDGFKFSPDESKVLFIAQVKYGERTSDLYPDLDKASGRVITDLMYKHWDEWVESIPHPFVATFDGNQVGEATDILKDEPYESPMKPFGGIEQLAWSNDSKQIAYTCRKKTGLEYSVSTDSDIYLYDTESGKTRNLCKEDATDKNLGYDTNPKFSPDGKSIAWQSMERDGYESDRNRLCVMNLKSGEKTYVTEAFQSGVDDYCWAPDGKTLYFVGVWHATSMIHSTNLKGEVKQLTDGMYDYTSVAMLNNKQLLTKRHSISEADELFTVDLKKKNTVTRITKENDHQTMSTQLADKSKNAYTLTGGQRIDRYSVYADQKHRLANNWGIGYGVSYRYTNNYDFQTYDNVTGNIEPENTDAKLEEQTTNFYFSLSKSWATGTSFSVSATGEYYTIGNYHKWAVYPQASLTYLKSPQHIFQLSLSTDKTYPGYWDMQSSVTYLNGYSEIQGTPGLRPMTTYNLNGNYILKQKYIFGLFYRHTSDYFAQSTYQATDRLALIYKNTNWNYMRMIGANVILPFSLGNWYDARLTLVGMQVREKCDQFFDIPFDRKKWLFVGTLDNTFKIGKNLSFELAGNIQTPFIQGTLDLASTFNLTAGKHIQSYCRNEMELCQEQVFAYGTLQ